MILSHKQNSLIHFSQTWSAHSDSAVPQSTSVSVPWCIFPPQDFRGACPHQKMQGRQTTESTGENLSYLKYETYNLPTAIVSNTLDYGKFDIWVYGKPLILSSMPSPPVLSYPKEQTQMITDFCSENADKFKGLPLETCLEVLDE